MEKPTSEFTAGERLHPGDSVSIDESGRAWPQGKRFDQWAILELFGHAQIAGKVSEQTIGGCSFVRVDVPAVNETPAFTRLFGNGAIYSITIVDEAAALLAARECQPEPMNAWTVTHLLKALPAPAEAAIDHSDLNELVGDDDDEEDRSLNGPQLSGPRP